jgi:glycosyltransferase involved in cell wall biosynthesis
VTYSGLRLGAVLWSGQVGGAETFTAAACAEMRRLGADVQVVFVTHPGSVGESLRAAGVPQRSLGLERGRQVIRAARRFARAVTDAGPTGAWLPTGGYLAGALRVGGYEGTIVATEHGPLVQHGRFEAVTLRMRHAERLLGVWAVDVDVAVSEFVRDAILAAPHPRRVVRIYNGVDLTAFHPRESTETRPAVFGCAGRLIPAKRTDDLLRAFADLPAEAGAQLRIAGDGPERPRLEALVAEAGLGGRVTFAGWVSDMAEFWRGCDVAVVSSLYVETFCMSAVEAMACGLPVVAYRSGALPEIIPNGLVGALVDAGDVRALSRALAVYAEDPRLRHEHGAAARHLCEERYDLQQTARAYLECFSARA